MSGLRVIAGKARGRRLHSVPGDSTRPITDRAKESLFNILNPEIADTTFLDLFAGTGAVGIEALSRGAGFVRFVDINRQAIETIRTNLLITGFEQAAEVLRTDALALLEHAPDRQFDFVYIAPPQYKGIWKIALSKLDSHPTWMADAAWVIVQIHPVEYEPLGLKHLVEFDQRRYGSTIFIFYEYQTQNPTDPVPN